MDVYRYCTDGDTILLFIFNHTYELVLTVNLAENWKRFKQELRLYLIATCLKNKSEEQEIALLLHVIGYNAFIFDATNESLQVVTLSPQIWQTVVQIVSIPPDPSNGAPIYLFWLVGHAVPLNGLHYSS